LTIYLCSPGVRTPTDALQPDHGAKRYDLTVTGVTGEFYLATAQPEAPRWLDFFDGKLVPKPTPPENATSAGALFIRAAGRWFVFTFGYGRFLLRLDRCERDFGLKVTINSVDAAQLRSIDLRTLDANSVHTRRQTSFDSPLELFGVDPVRDMLHAVTGRPRDAVLGTRVTGAGPLALSLPVGVEDLPELCRRLLPLQGRKDYQDRFGWIDEFETVEEAKRAELDTALLSRLNSTALGVHLAPPAAVDWASLAGFVYSVSPQAPAAAEVGAPQYLAAHTAAGLPPVTLQSLHEEELWAVTVDGTRLERWPIYETLLHEINQGGRRYVLTAGLWYVVDAQFAAMVDGYLARVKNANHLVLPAFQHADEAAYNVAVAATLDSPARPAVLLDKKTVRWTGNKTSIEFCDVMTSSGDFLHVKRETAATHISHLLNQGLVAGECFVQEVLCRDAVRDKIAGLAKPAVKDKLVAHFTAARPDPHKYKIIYVVIASTTQPLPAGLSFFSKVAMMNVVRRLFAFGYEVHMLRVPIAALPKALGTKSMQAGKAKSKATAKSKKAKALTT